MTNRAQPLLLSSEKGNNPTLLKSGFLPRERHPTAATRSFNLSFPVGGAVHTPDTRIKFGQIEHISGVSVGGGAVLFLMDDNGFPVGKSTAPS